jgi:PAS domain S-box-containing protein
MLEQVQGKILQANKVFVLGVLYLMLAVSSITLSKGEGILASFWYANAFGIAALLFAGKALRFRLIFSLAIANFFANWLMDNGLAKSFAFVIPNLVEMVSALFLLHRFPKLRRFDQSPERMLGFILIICFLPVVVGALCGASTLYAFGVGDLFSTFLFWFLGSAIGTLALLPFLLMAHRHSATALFGLLCSRITWMFVCLVLIVSYLAARYLPFPFIYIVLPLVLASVLCHITVVTMLVFIQSLFFAFAFYFGWADKIAVPSNVEGIFSYIPILLTLMPALILGASMNQFRARDRENKQYRSELLAQHKEQQIIIDHIPALIGFWDKDLKNRFANRKYEEYFGLHPDEILGKHISEVTGQGLFAKNRPFLEAALRGERQTFERTILIADGRTVENLASYVPSYRDGEIDGIYVFVSDVTELKRAQHEQFIAQERFQAVIDSATEFSIIATDVQGMVTVFSKGAEKMLGYTADEMVSKQSPAIIHLVEEVVLRGKELSAELGREVEGFEVFVAKSNEGLHEAREWTYVHKSGRQFPVRLVVNAIFDKELKPTGYLGIASDITEEKKLQTLLIAAKDNAERTSQAKSDFVANMSHEIRTPMNAVLGMSQLLAGTNLTPEQRKYLDMIRVSGQALMGILNDILDFSKIEANRFELVKHEFLLDEVLGALASMMAVTVGDKPVEVAIGTDTKVPKRLIGDALRLQQILTNLVSNALKFTSSGEVSVFVDIDDSHPQNSQEKLALRFTISDTGIGMDEMQIQRIFQPFSQADSSITRKFGGTGLGLSISKRIIDLMAGSISVTSELGKGSQFSVIVPLEFISQDVSEDLSKAANVLRVLVVDDNRTSNDYICRTVRSWNWLVESASCGQEAIDKTQTACENNIYYDAILVDWQMPMMDGLVTIKRLREMLPPKKTSLVVMVSAYGRDKMLQEQAFEHADAVLMKPMTGSSIFDTVHEATAHCTDREMIPHYQQVQVNHGQQLGGASILLVEDNPFNQIVARGFLEQAGALVVTMDNGHLAVEHLRNDAKDYDLVLMDVQMPIMDGISATRLIRNELKLEIPVIAMTAGVMYTERDRCLQSGMNDFIGKPIDVERMFSTILEYLPVKIQEQQTVAISHEQTTVAVTKEALPSVSFDPTSMEMLAKASPSNLQKILSSVDVVIERASLQMGQVRSAFEEGRTDDAARLLHTLRGSVGSFGAKTFAELTLSAENAIRGAQQQESISLIGAVEEELQKTVSAARSWLQEKQFQKPIEAMSPISDEQERKDIQHFKTCLQQNDLAALDLFLAMKTTLRQKMAAEVLSDLEKSINGLDFQLADNIMSEFLSKFFHSDL